MLIKKDVTMVKNKRLSTFVVALVLFAAFTGAFRAASNDSIDLSDNNNFRGDSALMQKNNRLIFEVNTEEISSGRLITVTLKISRKILYLFFWKNNVELDN